MLLWGRGGRGQCTTIVFILATCLDNYERVQVDRTRMSDRYGWIGIKTGGREADGRSVTWFSFGCVARKEITGIMDIYLECIGMGRE